VRYRLAITLFFVCAIARLAAQEKLAAVPDFVLWPTATIEAAADRLEKTIGDKSLVFETIGNYQGHSVYLVLRGSTGQAEIHETEEDVFIAKRGKATFVIGGQLVGEESMPRKQRRGTSIQGGEKRTLSPGDIVHIPRGFAHHLVIAPGERFMYVLFKFDEEPLKE
jgi:mannose-6-phosphate isomerase-like protein (cupin superfamily)